MGERERYRRVLFGAPAANWSNFASQTIVYRPRGGLTRVLHPTRVKEGVIRDFMRDQTNYVAQTGRGFALCREEKSYSALRLLREFRYSFKLRSFLIYYESK